jgi:TnpA family transposase
MRSTLSRLPPLWGEGDTSSSDGQFFRAGGHGEARADHNAHYGSEPGTKFYTHVSDRFAPFYTKVIAANASEAAHVLDGLLHYESSLVIREHYTDTGGATEHVFGLCHLLAFRFAPRLRDLADRRLYVAAGHADHGALDSLIGGVINLSKIEENWDETLRMTASIRAGTVAPSALLRRLASSPRLVASASTAVINATGSSGTAPVRRWTKRPAKSVQPWTSAMSRSRIAKDSGLSAASWMKCRNSR